MNRHGSFLGFRSNLIQENEKNDKTSKAEMKHCLVFQIIVRK